MRACFNFTVVRGLIIAEQHFHICRTPPRLLSILCGCLSHYSLAVTIYLVVAIYIVYLLPTSSIVTSSVVIGSIIIDTIVLVLSYRHCRNRHYRNRYYRNRYCRNRLSRNRLSRNRLSLVIGSITIDTYRQERAGSSVGSA
jgi:hypothetical protein